MTTEKTERLEQIIPAVLHIAMGDVLAIEVKNCMNPFFFKNIVHMDLLHPFPFMPEHVQDGVWRVPKNVYM